MPHDASNKVPQIQKLIPYRIKQKPMPKKLNIDVTQPN
jgi:hypothetical protein